MFSQFKLVLWKALKWCLFNILAPNYGLSIPNLIAYTTRVDRTIICSKSESIFVISLDFKFQSELCIDNLKLKTQYNLTLYKMLTEIPKHKADAQKRDHYDSISTETRRMLVKLTQEDGVSIRKASKALQIKYSTGKTLI